MDKIRLGITRRGVIKNSRLKQIAAYILCFALTVPVVAGISPKTADAEETEDVYAPVMNVDMTDQLGEIMHGASGFLYGISSEDVPTMNLITPLKPKVLATKGALGTEHPYADALDVAETFLAAGGEMVQMYNSNFYAIFGPQNTYQDYVTQFKEVIVPYVTNWKNEWKKEHNYNAQTGLDDFGLNIDDVLVYLPINEGTPVRSEVEGEDPRNAFEAYYTAIKEVDPLATVGGLNPAEYSWTHVPPQWQWDGWHTLLSYLYDKDALPDVVTWHQLERNEDRYKNDIEEFNHLRNIFAGEGNEGEYYGKVNGKDVDKIPADTPKIVINEIAQSDECGVPGALVSWIGRLEDAEAYGCLPFWHQADNLNDLAADSNEANSAWWLYKWYADMSGQRLKITTDDKYSGIYGVSTIDEKAKKATTLFGLGSEDGDAKVVLSGLDETDVFDGAKKVHVKIDAAYFKGFNSASEPETVLEGAFALSDGDLVIEMKDVLRSTGYRLTVTPASEDEVVGNLKTGSFHAIYEAEEADRIGSGNLGVVTSGKYFLSGPRVSEASNDKNQIGGSGLNNFTSNRGIEYKVNIPENGRYKLEFIYGNQVGMNRGDETKHKPVNQIQQLAIDGESSEMILKNTMEKEWTAIYTRYVDWEKGEHSVTIMGNTVAPESNIMQDALHVTAVGEYGENTLEYNEVFEAEEGDFAFNALYPGVNPVQVKNDALGYTGKGYVTGLNERSVKNGGGVRFNIVVKESGLYNLNLRYQSGKTGKAAIYVGNAARTFDGNVKEIGVSDTKGTWMNTGASVYLQKGVNIVDIDASVNISLDSLNVSEWAEGKKYSQEIDAVDTIPDGADETDIPYDVWSVRWNEDYIDTVYAGLLNGAEPYTTQKQVDKIADTELSPDGEQISYVVGRSLTGDENAESDVNKYLEFEVDVPEAGRYAMQLFHSNDEIFGTHGYNTKIIDKFANIKVNDGEAKRYFFINTISRDTFKEKTVYIDLKAGRNKIKIFNDNSWKVMKGLDDGQAKAAGLPDWREADPGQEVTGNYSSFYYDKPGNIPIVNSLPNFSKFVITPVFVGGTAVEDNPADDNGNVSITTAPSPVPAPVTDLKKGSSFISKKLSCKVLSIDADKKSGTVQVKMASAKNKLKKLTIPNTVSKDGYTFKVVKIAKNAFKNNKNITSVKIGNNVKIIDSGAFKGCKKLTRVVTGTSLIKIGKNAFANDKKLRVIDLRKSKKLKSVGSKAFKGIYGKAKIKAPKGKLKVYKKLLKKG